MNFKNFNVVQPQEQPKEEVNSAVKMANISIRVDANCFLLCDGEFTEIELQAGKITKVQLPVGQHLLEFVDIECPELKMEKVVDWPDEGKSYLVLVDKFKEVVDALKAKDAAERKAKEEAERKAKADALKAQQEAEKREKPIRYEVEDCIYELYPATYTAKLINSTGKNIAVLKTISYLDNDYSVTAIGDCACRYCSSLESIDIPDGVMSIGDSAFSNCKKLTSITIPNSVMIIGDYAFYCCRELTSITIPNSVMSIGRCAFSGCSSLTSIVIPDGVMSIGEEAFKSCGGLTSITIPNSVMIIGEEAFYSCSSLTSVVIPDGVMSIGKLAFFQCNKLTSVVIPDSVIRIGEGAFKNCFSLIMISYNGMKAQWKKIKLSERWNEKAPFPVSRCADGDVEI